MLLLVHLQKWQYKLLKTEPRFTQLLENLHQQLHGGTLCLELVAKDQKIFFYVHVSEDLSQLVIGQIYALYPDCFIEKIYNDYCNKDYNQKQFIVTQLSPRRSNIYPWKGYDDFEGDSLASIFSVLSKTEDYQEIWVQIRISPIVDNYYFNFKRSLKASKNNFLRFLRLRDILKSRTHMSFYDKEKIAMTNKSEELQYSSAIRIAVHGENKESSVQQLTSVEKAYTQFNTVDFNGFKLGKHKTILNIENYWRNAKIQKNLILGVSELTAMYYFPDPEIVPNLMHLLSRKKPSPLNLPKARNKNVIPFGKTNYHNQDIPFGILKEDRERHMYVVGKSGNGKSKFLELLIKKDIENGEGVCVMDPHGDLIDNVMKHIPESRIKDVVYFNPMDTDNPVAFNPLESISPKLKLRVTIGFIEVFKKLFGTNWTPRLEHMLRYTILALLDTPGTTVFSILKMLSDKSYRQKIVAGIEDTVVRNFWVNEFASWNEKFDQEAIMPLLNKVGQLVSTDLVRNMLGQPENTFNIREIMDSQKIFLVKLNKGLLGEENTELLGSMLITKIEQAALERSDTDEEKRIPFYLYCDEFQYFATETFTEILSEARKYKLFVTIAHQYIGQLPSTIRNTIFGNIGTMVSFRIGADDATILEREFAPTFSANDMINLGVREFYIKMSIHGQTHSAFSGNTLDLIFPEKHHINEIITYSQRTYGKPRKQVEKIIKNWDEGDCNTQDAVLEKEILDTSFKRPLIA